MRKVVIAQFFNDREGDRSRGLSEGLLNMTFIKREFTSQQDAEEYLSSLPPCDKMREAKWIE